MGWRVKSKSATPEIFLRDLAGIRTQDPILKRDVLYLLSYQINLTFFEVAKIASLF